jgi:class 3 adenylate cyclase/tetratricopeptide (TPR) repeat protein
MVDPPSVPREERKIITVLFADLVGFTARAEQLDPEDVRAILSPYYARLRRELERFGGTVEKFIGDAVMALFGAPVAHEDDPERAVRAALAIRDWALEQGPEMQLRIAVNTGEALIALGARPNEGEGMASGDVVNTTARMQSAAPVNGILVSETTYRATSHLIEYRAAKSVSAKGKTEPVLVWEALEARSRLVGDGARSVRSPLIGRKVELAALSGSLARVRRERRPELVSIIGVPGIGKSRLLAELSRAIDADPLELITWRQGRSLPYGDGVTFWALAEIVKGQAQILETDSPELAVEKLRAAVSDAVSDHTARRWIEGHLRPLAGIRGDIEVGSDRRDEAFTAWRRFFEGLAEQHLLVLVFEDLHWADASLLDFIELLVDQSGHRPILVVCTARPELLERRAGWAAEEHRGTTLWLSPLSEEETGQLIRTFPTGSEMPAPKRESLLARAGGNPLYAEQYMRMLAEREDADELALPETVQGIIAARLDALPVEEKSLLQNAAVIGKVFWLGAVTEMGGSDPPGSEVHLHALERKEFVQRTHSTVANEAEYTFLHVLLRDVAYGQIPRGRRAEKHCLAADWIESLARSEDHAEMLAHHFLSAVELRRATGQPVDVRLTQRALTSLREAGDRAFSLNAYANAGGFYESALALIAAASPERARLLFKLGRTRFVAGADETQLLAAARDELLACGDHETAAEVELLLAELGWFRGDRDLTFQHVSRARELVEQRAPSRVKAQVSGSMCRYLRLAGESAEAIRLGREALQMAEHLGLDDVRASVLNDIGVCRVDGRDFGGIEDLEQSLAIAIAANIPTGITRGKSNLAAIWWERGQLERAYALYDEAEEAVRRFGMLGVLRWFRGARVQSEYVLGRWQQALAGADEFLAEVETGSPHTQASVCYLARAHIRLAHDEVQAALADVEHALELARIAQDPQNLYPALAEGAHIFREAGDLVRAGELADECLAGLRAGGETGAVLECVHTLAWTLAAHARGEEFLEAVPSIDVPWVQAARSFAAGDLRHAADICAAMGAAPDEARDRLWLAAALIEQNRRAEADVELQRALTFYRSVGATRYIREAEALLAASA